MKQHLVRLSKKLITYLWNNYRREHEVPGFIWVIKHKLNSFGFLRVQKSHIFFILLLAITVFPEIWELGEFTYFLFELWKCPFVSQWYKIIITENSPPLFKHIFVQAKENVCVCVCVRVHTHARTQSCSSLLWSMDCSQTSSSVYEIFQARTLEWVAIS